MSADIKNKLKNYLKNKVPLQINEIDEKQDLIDSGLLDSAGIIELLCFVEQEFGIKIREHEILEKNFKNIESLIKFINLKRAE